MIKKCLICKNDFKIKLSKVKIGRGKTCSYKCRSLYLSGSNNPNFGKDFSGKNNAFFGRKHSMETKEKYSLERKGHWLREKNPRWNNGKCSSSGKYIFTLKPGHPSSYRNYIYEHREIIENIIKRNLKTDEEVHHIDRDRSNNRVDNLIAFVNHSAHMRFHRNPNLVKPEEIIFDGRNH